MSFYRGMTCENVTIKGDKGTPITAYVARPSGPGPFPGVVLIHHLPGWSELYIETTRRLAHHGYLAICANLYEREGGGSDGNPDDVAAKVRAEGGIADSQMVGDTEAAVKWMRALGDVITLDFINTELDPGARAGIELTLETAKALRAALDRAIAAAEFEEAEVRGKGVVLGLVRAA